MLALALIDEGEDSRALEVIERSFEVIPADKIPHDYYSIPMVKAFVGIGNNERALELANTIISESIEYIDFIIQLDLARRYDLNYITSLNWQSLIELYNLAGSAGIEEITNKIDPVIDVYYNELFMRPGQ